MQEKVWVDDGLVEAEGASVSVFDAGLLHGVGLFETMRAAAGTVFRLDDHLDRLTDSAEKLGVRLRTDADGMRQAVDAAIRANGLTDARVRLTATSGSLRDAAAPGDPGGTLIVTAAKFVPYPREYYARGMTVVITPYRQQPHDPLAGHKTTNYFGRLAALRQAQQLQAGEALWFTPNNLLAEGSISNVFIVRSEKLLTPAVDTPVLAGITRSVVLSLAKQLGIESRQTRLTINELLEADEVFLTNSIMGIMPVCRVERHAIGEEKPGPISSRLADAYEDLVRKECGVED